MRLAILALLVAWPAAAGAQAADRTYVFFSRVHAHDQEKAKRDPRSIDRKLAAYIEAAKKTLDAALFEIHNDTVVDALVAAHRRRVKVRLVSDGMYRFGKRVHACPHYARVEAARIPIVYDDKNGYMHNKFVVRDHRCVWTGSFNVADSEAWRNHNNAIQICSPALAANYTAEFEEMFLRRKFGPGSPANTSTAPIRVGRMTVRSCFAPEDFCGRKIVDAVRGATSRIRIMTFSLSDYVPRGPERLSERRKLATLRTALLERKRAGVDVRAVVERAKARARGSLVPDLLAAGIPVRGDGNPGLLHSKVIVLDGKTTITGSYNFSGEAEHGNDENLVIVESATVARRYEEEFDRIWSKGREVPGAPTCDPKKPVDVNRATTTALAALPGMGWKGAALIRKHRPYASLDDLVARKVLSQRKLDAIRACLTVADTTQGRRGGSR